MDSSHEHLELIKRSQSGDLDAFGLLVRAHQGWLRGWLRGQLRDWTAADDLAQDAFVTAFKKIREFRGDGSFEAWLRSIAHNHFRNHIRKKREDSIGGDLELQALLDTGDDDEFAVGNDTIDALKFCMSKVKGPSNELLHDRYVTGKSVQEIAAEQAQGYSAITMKLHRLRKSLASCIENQLAAENA
ncbi:sigma-70 family RNA polymerase sigma factor [Verrucomicrobiaceae bacterium R5-34]|nr:sigma-70 family RNA polymerase sigma factor [Verrucomicrobiaceae bacterium R5-34]